MADDEKPKSNSRLLELGLTAAIAMAGGHGIDYAEDKLADDVEAVEEDVDEVVDTLEEVIPVLNSHTDLFEAFDKRLDEHADAVNATIDRVDDLEGALE